MSEYIVSARKYRPSTFDTVVGQQGLTSTLKNAISNNKLAHAYLFCGPRGVGKTTCARIFAKTINCITPLANGEACDECESCKSFNELRSLNVLELDAASNNSVDDIRELTNSVRIPPQVGKYKVYIIDEVHMLSTQAFNAFLKTLEEPPKHAIFILATTEKHKILPTILSRCQIYDFNRITIKDTVAHLQSIAKKENISTEVEALNLLAQKADGGMRDALSIFDQIASFTNDNITYQAVIENLNILDFEYYFRIGDVILNKDVPESMIILNNILSSGFDGENIINGLANHFRDILLCKTPKTADLFSWSKELKDKYTTESSKFDYPLIYEIIDKLAEAELKYKNTKNKTFLLQLTFIQLCQIGIEKDTDSKKKNI